MIPIPTGYVEIETPPEDEPLMAGDLVDIRYVFIDQGAWIEAFQTGRIERAINEDSRLLLRSYAIDRTNIYAMLITFRIEVLQNNVGKSTVPALAASIGPVGIALAVTLALIVGYIAGAGPTWLNLNVKPKINVSRKVIAEQERILSDPNATPEQKEVAKEVLEAAQRGEETTVSEAMVTASWAVGLVVVLLILRMFFK